MWKPTLPSNRQWKKRVSDGIGLRIALEKSTGYETPMKHVVNSFSLHRISPWPPAVMSISSAINYSSDVGCMAMDHFGHCKRSLCKELSWEDVGSFCRPSPRKPQGQPARFSDEMSDFKVAGFLRSCYLCRKNLDGKDIYMYRGEKAFCSTECRYQQVIGDEHQV